MRWSLFFRTAYTAEGRAVIRYALALSHKHPELSDAELIRLAYWGATGASQSRIDEMTDHTCLACGEGQLETK